MTTETDPTENDPTDAVEPGASDTAAADEPVAGKAVATEPATAEADTSVATEAGVGERAARKLREGVAVSTKMDKTVVIAVVDRVRHPKYAKYMQRTKKLYAHDEAGEVNVGDRVRVMETRPLSKLKRWRVVEVLERAK
jgi:small subunit ribosomal protein S17